MTGFGSYVRRTCAVRTDGPQNAPYSERPINGEILNSIIDTKVRTQQVGNLERRKGQQMFYQETMVVDANREN